MNPTTDPAATGIHVGQFLAHPPSRVWQALVDPEALGAWFMASGVGTPLAGSPTI